MYVTVLVKRDLIARTTKKRSYVYQR